MPSEERYSHPAPADVSLGDLVKPKNLREIMNCHLLSFAFREYCESELLLENVNFWEEVGDYKRLPDEERIARFLVIYEKYFNSESDYELNVSSTDSKISNFHHFFQIVRI
jgi:hypothetical protein